MLSSPLRILWVIGFISLLQTPCGVAQEAPKVPRAARSVHLQYPGTNNVNLFYNEVVVEGSVNGSYFMACGWNTGYFGIQQLGNSNKVAIMSVWDPTRGDNPKSVPADQQVEVLYEGPGVRIKRFGGEGTGAQSMTDFNWTIGQTNKFVIQAEENGEKTAYSAFLFLPSENQWKKLASFRTHTSNKHFTGFYSFVEDFRRDTKSATQNRRARYGNGWVRTQAGDWFPLANARFTASNSEWEAKETIDAGKSQGWFYLSTGGDTKSSRELRSMITLEPATHAPDVSFTK
ncbi:MAG: hypothetical protein JWM04_1369 [Verrucomicrobiales bacterium]|jgi:hypothetical protein|nr:hypothetical protein [Verrucomicrobiales bacterium]